MRLINISSPELTLEYYVVADSSSMPPYAILSHTWDLDEVRLSDMENGDYLRKEGFSKMHGFCSVAREHGLEYAWMDSCCIDATSSAELSETINLMFSVYQEAKICIAYLGDVMHLSEIYQSRWFTRG